MSTLSTPLVIYHGNCQDGFTAAWACWKVHPDWEFVPATHGEPPPSVHGRLVYMLDFSYKKPVIEKLAQQAERIIILDHHKTAEEDLYDLPQNVEVHFDLEKSGAMLAWEYFHGNIIGNRPMLVDYVQDRDLWKFKYSETKPISAFIFAQDYDFFNWDSLVDVIEHDLKEVVMAGYAINKKQAKDVKELCQKQFKLVVDGHEVPVANLPYTFSSDAGHYLSQGQPFAATYYYDGENYNFSLRSKEDGLDVAEIAKKYGGGGHAHASGFRVKNMKDGKIW